MPSKSLPLSHPPCCSTLRRVSPPAWTDQPSRINWPIVLASVSLSFTLVSGVLAWIATHPHRAAPQPQLTSVALVPPVEPSTPPETPVFPATPAFCPSPPTEFVSCYVPSVEVNSPSLPPPASPQPKQEPEQWDQRLADLLRLDRREAAPPSSPLPKQPPGETYGTEVLFLNNREAAAEMARHEHKLLFVMHISGNFEDSCFT